MGKLLKWIVYSNFWISLSVVCFVLYGIQLELFQLHVYYLFLVFFSTLFAYNFQRLLKVNFSNPAPSERHIWIQKHFYWIRLITIFSGISAIAVGLMELKISDIFLAAPMIIIVLFYVGNKWINWSIRLIPYLKILAVSMVWTIVVFIFPVFQQQISWTNSHTMYLAVVFIFTFSLCIPFDIRDLKSDKGQVHTIPTALGVKKAKFLAAILMIVLIALTIYSGFWAFLISGIFGLGFVLKTKEDNPDLFFTAGIDGLFVLLPIFHGILEFFGS